MLLPRLFLLLVFHSLIASASAQTAADALTADLSKLYRKAKLPGFSVAIVTKDSVWYEQGFGYADIQTGRPYTPQTIQNVGSVSKTVIGVALMKAVEQGLFTLDTPINQILPFRVENPHQPDKAITVRHLATHTSGIIDRPDVYKQSYLFRTAAGTPPAPALAQYLRDYLHVEGAAYSAHNFQGYAPGQSYAYSNIGAALAAYLIEVKSGESFADYSRKHILQPLALTASSWAYTEAQAAQYATNYQELGRAYPPYSLITYPDGGWRTSCHDLGRYLREILKGYAGEPSRLLKPASFATMLHGQFTPEQQPLNLDSKEPNAGVFWAIRANQQIGHTGSDPGTTVLMFFSPTTGVGKILMVNADTGKQTSQDIVAAWRLLESYEQRLATR
ncbi:serine hydrolase domain-containing protein [Hymenobacter koreensis]|uniref:Serine hydrolase domain-containing protein n=1 Tax=Hymenobacter koreensis TaxID=1084523 RepID=A0ABP8IT74_9BACT